MGEYLKEAPFEEAMKVFYSGDAVAPLVHTVWTGDFMALCTHDIPCPVCFDRSAMIERNVTPGQWKQEVQPCDTCSKIGWRVVKLPRWLRWMFRL